MKRRRGKRGEVRRLLECDKKTVSGGSWFLPSKIYGFAKFGRS